MKNIKLQELVNLIIENAKFDQEISEENSSSLSYSSNNEERFMAGVSFEFDVQNDDGSIDEEQSEDFNIYFDKNLDLVSVEHPYLTNEAEVLAAITDFIKANA